VFTHPASKQSPGRRHHAGTHNVGGGWRQSNVAARKPWLIFSCIGLGTGAIHTHSI
jgi:hypothetical protein